MACSDQISTEDLLNAKLDATTLGEVATSRAGAESSGAPIDTTINRFGETTDTTTGRLKKMGYKVPVTYVGGISFTVNDNVKTVDEAGIVYAPLPSVLPFTTSGTWLGDDDARFFVVQGVTNDQLINDISQAYEFATVDAMTSSVIVFPLGKVLRTVAYSSGDGGSEYIVSVNQVVDGKGDHLLSDGKAALIRTNSAVDSSQFGGTPAIIYVATTGSDSNSGFDPALPLLTPQAAASRLSGFGAYLTGKWEVSFSAGNYTKGFELDSATQADFPIDIYGPVAGHPNVPTAVFDMATSSSESGIRSAVQSWVRATDIKVINAITGNAFEVNTAQLALTNCHTYNCLVACTTLHRGFISARGGIWDGNDLPNSIGYQSFYNSTHDLIQTSNDAATDALVIKNFDRGMLINEGVQGHVDNVNLLDCTSVGLNIKRGAGAVNTKTMKIDGCGVGVLAESNAWFDNGISYGSITPNTIDIKTLGVSPELIRRTQTREFIGDNLPAFAVAAHTGTVTKTTIHSFDTLPKEFMGQVGHILKGELECTLSNSSGLVTNVEVAFGTQALASIAIPITEVGAIIRFRVVILSKDGANNVISYIEYLGRTGIVSYIPGVDTLDMGSADRQLNLRVTLGGVADSLTVRAGTYETTVGG